MNQFLELALSNVRMLADKLETPEDDIPPHVLVETPIDIKCLRYNSANDEEKYAFCGVALPMFLLQKKALQFVHVTMAWSSRVSVDEITGRPLDYLPEVRPRDDPKRHEILVVVHVAPAEITVYIADVVRSKNMPPCITELIKAPEAESNLLQTAIIALNAVNRSDRFKHG